MRLFPILSAILVTLFLYAVIMERDAVLSFAGGANATEAPAAEATTASGTAVAESTEGAEPAEVDARQPVRVVTQMSEAREIDSAVILRGQTEALRSVELRAETTGTVASTPIRKGARVEEGDVLCHLDPGTRQDTLDEAEARLAEAEAAVPTSLARVEEARAMLNEAQINNTAAGKLSEGGFASSTRVAATEASVRSAEAGLAQAEAGLSSSQAAIQSAQAAVAAARRELSRTKIHAPFGGLIEDDTAELGALLQAGGLCATILQLDPIKLVAFVPETEVDRIRTGAQAGARLTGREGHVTGAVTFLSRSADPQTRTFRVEIEVPNADLAIRDGQTAEIAISAQGVKAHLLPQSALTLDDTGALGVRIVTGGDTADFAPVKLLRDTAEGVWVSGLPDMAQVIIIGQDYVIAGVPVAPSVRETTQ